MDMFVVSDAVLDGLKCLSRGTEERTLEVSSTV